MLIETDRLIVADGDGFSIDDLVAAVSCIDPDEVAGRVSSLDSKLIELNTHVDEAAAAHGDARRTFADLEDGATSIVETVRIVFESLQRHAGVERLIRQPRQPYVFKARFGFLGRCRIDEFGGLKPHLGIFMAQQP